MNVSFNHQGISESMAEIIAKHNASCGETMPSHLFFAHAATTSLAMAWQIGQSLLSIACELQRFNDREEAKASK